jgi:hypothetical protein
MLLKQLGMVAQMEEDGLAASPQQRLAAASPCQQFPALLLTQHRQHYS